MTPLALWSAVALIALVATACWLLLARETGVYVTSSLSFVTWAWLALTGGDVAMLTGQGQVWVRSLASLQFLATALALVSLVVLALRTLGAYPSPRDNIDDRNSCR